MSNKTPWIVSAVLIVGLSGAGYFFYRASEEARVANEARAEQRARDAEASATKAEKARLVDALTKQQATIDALLQRLAVAKDDAERAVLQKQIDVERAKLKALVDRP